MIRQFQFLDPRATAIEQDVANLRAAVGTLPAQPSPEQLKAAIAEARKIERKLDSHFQAIDDDYKTLDERTPTRLLSMPPDEVTRFRAEMEQERDKLVADQAAVRIVFRQHGLDR